MKSIKIITIFIISVVVPEFHQHHYRNISHHHQKSQHIQHIHLVHILKSQKNAVNKTYENIQSVINKLFGALKPAKEFMDMPKTKSLIIMLSDLNNIASKNLDLYHTLRNVSKVEANNNAVKKIRLDEMVREIISENQFEVNIKAKDKNGENAIKIGSTSVATELTSRKFMPTLNQRKKFKLFTGKFLGQVNSFKVNDVIKNKSSEPTRRSRRSLKVWVQPADLKDWYNKSLITRRIFHGKRTNIKTFPFIVSIHFMHEFTCSGSIIRDDLIITAASCLQLQYNNRLFRENAKNTFVRIGSDWTSRLGDLVPVLEIFFYPTYDPKTLRNNLAILRLIRAIKFLKRRRSKVKRIKLDTNNGQLPSDTREIVMLGWGARQMNQGIKLFEKLQVSFLPLYPWEDCRRIYSKDHVTETNFCAGYMSKGSWACNRDVGAPGVSGGKLVGIVSFGSPTCGAVNSPTVFTKIGNYIDWIESIEQLARIVKEVLRYGATKITPISSRGYLYYHNTMTSRTYPIMLPFLTSTRHYRARPEYTAFDEAIDKNFYISKFPAKQPVHGTISKAMYIIPTVQYETLRSDFNEIMTQGITESNIDIKPPSVEPESFSLQLKTSTAFIPENVYENHNYENVPPKTEKAIQKDDYTSSDTDISRKEYLEHNRQKQYGDDDSEQDSVFA